MVTIIPSHHTATRINGSTNGAVRSNWMLYGAYGVTGRKILEEALGRGHRPVLAGRDSAQLADLAKATGLSATPISLDDGPSLRTALSRVTVVLNAAGPF